MSPSPERTNRHPPPIDDQVVLCRSV
jgi:hypothetical protein